NNSFVIGGTVDYQRYSGLDCQSANKIGSAETERVPACNAVTSRETTGLSAGNYRYQASYSGDTNYASSTGACEPFTVNQAASSTATIVNDHANNLVDSGSNNAALDTHSFPTRRSSDLNNSFVIGGTVDYQRYSGLDCQSANKIGSA